MDDDAVPALLRRATAAVYPALYEGFGLPALEALSCGTPLVTTSGTAMEEVAGDAAVLVPPGDLAALTDVLDAVLAGSGSAGPTPTAARGVSRSPAGTPGRPRPSATWWPTVIPSPTGAAPSHRRN